MQAFLCTLVFLFTFQTVQLNAVRSLDASTNADSFNTPFGDGCWFEDGKSCETSTGFKAPDDKNINTPALCLDFCINDCPDCVDGGCKFWTYYGLNEHHHECYALSECVESAISCKIPSIDDNSKCASGLPGGCPPSPAACTAQDFLPDLFYAHWWCASGNTPYGKVDVESGDTCFIDCPSFTNSNGDGSEPTLVSSTCEDGTWSAASPGTVSDSAETPVPVETPESSPNPTCGCSQINIKPDTLINGAELYEKAVGSADYTLVDTSIKVEIKGSSTYLMFCDRHLALEISCTRGVWSEGIKDCRDIYCWEKPADEAACKDETK